MLVSVGSGSNVDDADTHPGEFHRADVLEYTPEGKFIEVYATASATAWARPSIPLTGQLWCSTNERDNLGNHLVPDYVTSVPEKAASSAGPGITWAAISIRRLKDPARTVPAPTRSSRPRSPTDRPRTASASSLAATVRHSRRSGAAAHGLAGDDLLSNRRRVSQAIRRRRICRRTRLMESRQSRRLRSHSHPHARWPRRRQYEDFLTGFVTKDGQVWGRPVGVAVAKDGSLFVTDDGSRSVWHVTYTGK